MKSKTALVALATLLVSEAAFAGGGPWTLSPDDRSLFIGGGYTRWQNIKGGPESEPDSVGATITRSTLSGEFTYGLVQGAEFEMRAGVAWAGVGPVDGGLCDYKDTCETSIGLTPIRTRVKVRFLDELNAPLSMAAGLALRFGDFTQDSRNRLTALGDGQTDVGAFLAAGRGGALGGAAYSTSVEVAGRHRLALTTIRGQKVPSDELAGNAEFLVYPNANVSLGPAVDAVHALGGLNLGDLDFDNPDVFTSLAVTSVKVGGKVNIRSTENVTVSMSAFATVYAKNNPADFITIGFGIGTYTPAGDGGGA